MTDAGGDGECLLYVGLHLRASGAPVLSGRAHDTHTVILRSHDRFENDEITMEEGLLF